MPGSGADADGSMAPSSAPASAEPQNVIRPAERRQHRQAMQARPSLTPKGGSKS
ncbi:hypothetical protein [Escherichia coli]|uniref:hypothetical protein n=1 Tax=Escherichia coli TaxID=562 RepID=UPI00388F1016